jgi:hypothetical protein
MNGPGESCVDGVDLRLQLRNHFHGHFELAFQSHQRIGRRIVFGRNGHSGTVEREHLSSWSGQRPAAEIERRFDLLIDLALPDRQRCGFVRHACSRRKSCAGSCTRCDVSLILPIVFFVLAYLPAGQEDQRPRPAAKVDPLYFDLAAKTGGDFYFWAPGEFATARLQVPIHHEDVVLSYGSMDGKRRFEIPVESGVKELTLFAGVERKDLAVLVRPDGTAVHNDDPGVQVFQRMLIAKITAPAAGLWQLEIDGAGMFAVTAHVRGADDGPDLDRFQFDATNCAVSLSGAARDVQLAFVSMDGTIIDTISLTRTSDGQYMARCTIAKVPFRAVVRGIDGNGARFQRIESHLRE